MNNIMQDHLKNLRVISKLQEGQSLDTNKKLAIYEPTWFNWILRKISYDNKYEVIRFLRDFYRTLEQSTEQLICDLTYVKDKIKKNKLMENVINLTKQLKLSFVGLDNLMKTYKKYPEIVADLESITQDIAILTYKQLLDCIPENKIDNLTETITINGQVIFEIGKVELEIENKDID